MPAANSSTPPKWYPASKPSDDPAYGLPSTPQYVAPNPTGAYMAAAYPVNTPPPPPPPPGEPSVAGAIPSAPPAESADTLPTASDPLAHFDNSGSSFNAGAGDDAPVPPGCLRMDDAGAFSDLMSKVKPVSAGIVTRETAAERLVALKEKFNELQKVRAQYHKKQVMSGAATAGGALFSLGFSVIVGGASAVHQRNRLQQLIKAMRQCIEQINLLRAEYASNTKGWDDAEKRVLLEAKAFSKALNRNELHGDF